MQIDDKIPFLFRLVVENEVWNIDWSMFFFVICSNFCFTDGFWLCMMLLLRLDGTLLMLGFELLIFTTWLFPETLCANT